MAKGLWYMINQKDIKANLLTDWEKVMEYTILVMVDIGKDSGLKITSMDKVNI